MAKNIKTVKQVGSSKKDDGSPSEHFAAWRNFYAAESQRLRAKHPGMKGTTLRKRVSNAYKREKRQQKTGEEKGGSGDRK
ncbi:hypothetical protein JCM10449v2_003260 [Rhodotorula kratochvilovae]